MGRLSADTAQPDAILLDLDIDKQKSIDLLSAMNKALSVPPHPPIVLTAPMVHKSDLLQMMPNAYFLPKPIKQNELLSAISQAVLGKSGLKSAVNDRPTIDQLRLNDQLALNILLAEDNIVNQKVAVNMFKRLGFKIDIAPDGVQTLQKLREQPYDIIFMDVQMPEMDGIEATKIINKEWGADRPLIVAMTANAMAGDRERFLAAGMDDYVSKPVRIEDIRDAILRVKNRETSPQTT